VKNNEVSVAELLIREGWDQHVPPKARSRWRVVAVMVAVVLGCGVAAIVRFSSGAPEQQTPDLVSVIGMPPRTSGLAGADAIPSSDSPTSQDGTTSDPGTSTGDSSGETTTSGTASVTTTPTTSETAPTTSGRDDTTTSGVSTTSGTSTSTSTPPPPPSTPTTTPSHCFLWPLINC
jgi:hypothetical protein